MLDRNMPPKDIASQIWNYCFDFQAMDNVIDGETVEERINNCWDGIHHLVKIWIENDEKGFIDFIKKGNPVLPGRGTGKAEPKS